MLGSSCFFLRPGFQEAIFCPFLQATFIGITSSSITAASGVLCAIRRIRFDIFQYRLFFLRVFNSKILEVEGKNRADLFFLRIFDPLNQLVLAFSAAGGLYFVFRVTYYVLFTIFYQEMEEYEVGPTVLLLNVAAGCREYRLFHPSC